MMDSEFSLLLANVGKFIFKFHLRVCRLYAIFVLQVKGDYHFINVICLSGCVYSAYQQILYRKLYDFA